MDIKAWPGLAIHTGEATSALPAAFRDASPTVVLAYTVIVTALLLGLVGLVGLFHRRSPGATDSGATHTGATDSATRDSGARDSGARDSATTDSG